MPRASTTLSTRTTSFGMVPGLLGAASVPATVVNWGGDEAASIEEWCGYLSEPDRRAGVASPPPPTPSTASTSTSPACTSWWERPPSLEGRDAAGWSAPVIPSCSPTTGTDATETGCRCPIGSGRAELPGGRGALAPSAMVKPSSSGVGGRRRGDDGRSRRWRPWRRCTAQRDRPDRAVAPSSGWVVRAVPIPDGVSLKEPGSKVTSVVWASGPGW